MDEVNPILLSFLEAEASSEKLKGRNWTIGP